VLKKTYRLKKSDYVKGILKDGNTIDTTLFIVKYRKTYDTGARFTVITSTKLLKSAVKRVQLRRRVYESIRCNYTIIDKKNVDVALIPKKKIIDKKYIEINEDIVNILTTLAK